MPSAKKLLVAICVALLAAGLSVVAAVSADAGTRPTVGKLSASRSAYWGGRTITVTGTNFTKVQRVMFGSSQAWYFRVLSPTSLRVTTPRHSYGKVYVRVVTVTGMSAKTSAARLTYTKPRMSDAIQGGLTGRQAQAVSSQVRAAHKSVKKAKKSSRWTAAMGRTALKRARSWLGLPYSWAGGNGSGPTTGVCSHNGGDLDCHIVGFDCSGLTLNAWWPYKHMAHYAQTQKRQAGKWHPATGELMPGDLVFFSGYIAGGVGHVAIYEGNGNVIEAPQSGAVVRRSRLADVIASDGVYRGATRPLASRRLGARPVVTSSPATVSTRGGKVTITGRNLAGATAVQVGKKMIYSFVSRSATKLVVTVPARKSGKTSLRVSNAWGTVKRTVRFVKPAKPRPPVVTPPPTSTPPTSTPPTSTAPTSTAPTSTAPVTTAPRTTSPAPSATPSKSSTSPSATASPTAPKTPSVTATSSSAGAAPTSSRPRP